MLKTLQNPKYLLILLLLFTLVSRLVRIDYPKGFVFDEVYHVFTAKEYLKNNHEAWEFWTTPPPGVAFEWTHPPVAKEIMALSMLILNSQEAWAWRLPGVLFGVLSVFAVYLIGKQLFKNESIALASGFIFSIDGLNFVQSRTGMNDIYFVTFMLFSLYFLLRHKFIISSIFFGLSISSKWAAIYFLGIIIVLLLKEKLLNKILLFIIMTPIIYLLFYLPFFLQGHDWGVFVHLQQQMWWYHTGLKATHDYSSPWWSWPLNLYPVWYFVEYHKNGWMSNIFASGNFLVFWLGLGAIILSVLDYLAFYFKSHTKNFLSQVKYFLKNFWSSFWSKENGKLLVILLGYFAFFVPWAFSPRIMFLYHYSPSIPFLSLALGYQLYRNTDPKVFRVFLILMLISFLVYFPILTGVPLPKYITMFFFKTNITPNPFD